MKNGRRDTDGRDLSGGGGRRRTDPGNDGRSDHGGSGGQGRTRRDEELFWMAVVIAGAVLVGLQRSWPSIRQWVSDWWERWSPELVTGLIVTVSLLVTAALALMLTVWLRRRAAGVDGGETIERHPDRLPNP
jgi:hypothetical protein